VAAALARLRAGYVSPDRAEQAATTIEVWPGRPLTIHDRGWTWPGMAWCLWLLAPLLAPTDS